MINNKISARTSSLGLELNFLNGRMIVPDTPGGYIIAPGCGVGKTTAIKDIIKFGYLEGVAYFAFTIKECDEMANWVFDYLIPDIRNNSNIPEDKKLNESDVIVLHSEYSHKGVDNNLWRNNTKLINDKKIIIGTHSKLLSEDPRILFKTSFNFNNSSNHGLYCDAMQISGPAPRRWILIDELPTQSDIGRTLDKNIMKSIMSEEHINYSIENGIPCIKDVSYSRVKDIHLSLKRIENKKKSLGLYLGNDTHSRLCNELIISRLFDDYDRYFKEDSYDGDTIRVRNVISNLIVPGMVSHILLFDGTGDLTFKYKESSILRKFKVLTYDNKYNSDIKIIKFPFGIKRKTSSSVFIRNIDKISILLTESVNELERIIKDNNQTLIVTWNNLKSSSQDYESTEYINPNMDMKSFYRNELSSRGVIGGYEIIHYMSGLDKATNDYREFDSIVFLGNFRVPDKVVSDFNIDYWTDTDIDSYTLYQLVQAICRTRIRKHKGESIRIYFSEDWDDDIISKLSLYLKNIPITNQYIKETIIYDETLNGIRPKWRGAIRKLMERYPDFRKSILSRTSGKLIINLDEIYKLIPLKEKQVRAYNSLTRYLGSLGILLIIESNKSKYNNMYD
jgi:hypothetical protein